MASGRTRRQFLSAVGGLAGSIALGATAPAAASSRLRTAATARGTVAVLGGGVSGLSVAHELAERGYAVTVHPGAPL
jgi:NADPH-dependent glutamate synthase beta subunit-like oxidoreductase